MSAASTTVWRFESLDPSGVDTSDPAWRKAFRAKQEQMNAAVKRVLNGAKVDRITLTTPDDHAGALTRFFQQRMRRLAH